MGADLAEAISVIIPNWNGAGFLPACLDSLAAQSYRDFRVYVVDNGSTDGSVALLRSRYPWVEVVALPENQGFAGGMNRGFEAAGGALLIALNNDVECDPDWLRTVADAMQAHPEAGLAASQLMDFKDRTVVDSLGDGFMPYGLSIKAWSGQIYPDSGLPVRKIQSPCAAAAVYRREIIETLGGYDEDFFAYMEDIDLGLRAGRAGHACIFIPGARVYHIGSATSGGGSSAFSMRLTVRNTYQVIVLNVPWPLVPVYICLTATMHLGALAVSFLPGRFDWIARNRGAVLSGLGAAVAEMPRSLRKRRARAAPVRQSLAAFVATTQETYRFRPVRKNASH